MKKLFIAGCFLLLGTTVWAQPDVRDSIILESKSVEPGHRGETDTSAYLYVKVYITNKDSLAYMVLSLKEVSTYNGVYGILGYPRTFTGVITPLTPSFRYGVATIFSKYDGISPDSFVIGAGADGTDPNTFEPPNGVRKAVWEIKFDSAITYNYPGTFELDSAVVSGQPGCYFTKISPVADLPVNFVKSVITVAYDKGDMNEDGRITAVDIIWTILCVFNEMTPPAGVGACDLNCDGRLSAADVVFEIEFAINERPFPC
ncbi:MAG: dockerin type I domain-containing protein [candidate division Zixibacteria bacterium]|nr:dockerin type I domain-containing protein [candidate division Zixibacteria bacterium]